MAVLREPKKPKANAPMAVLEKYAKDMLVFNKAYDEAKAKAKADKDKRKAILKGDFSSVKKSVNTANNAKRKSVRI